MDHRFLVRGLTTLVVVSLLAGCGSTASPTATTAAATPTAAVATPTAAAATPTAAAATPTAAAATPTAAAATPTAAAATPTAEPSPSAAGNDVLTKEQISAALQAEGRTVFLKSWDFLGLSKDVFPDQFKRWTQAEYGVPVDVVWDSTNGALQQAEQAGKLPSEVGLDVIDSEEDHDPKLNELGWIEKIDQPQYANVLTNWSKVEPAYIVGDGMGAIYQGFEWIGPVARTDKIDVASFKDWTDLAKPEFKGKIVTYVMKDTRGQIIFYAILNSLIKQGIVKGDLWSPEAVTEGLKWFKANIAPNVLKYGDIPEFRTTMQSGEAGTAITWASYIRDIQASDWNARDNVVQALYPVSGIGADREELRVAKGTQHPVGARVLINWMLSRDFLMLGWFKDSPTGTDTNHWGVSKQQFLGAYTGGVNAEDRKLLPDFAVPFYPADPAALTLKIDFGYLAKNLEAVGNEYAALP
jgi:ABC-type Fe3+ transport system substrate-binding protein